MKGVILAATLSVALAVSTTAAVAGAPAPAQPDNARDWSAAYQSAVQSLGSALDDAARSRPVAGKLASTRAAFDDLLEHAPLSDRDRARVLYNRAVASLAMDDPAAAVLDLRRSDTLAPGRAATERELEAARARVHESAGPTPGTTPGPIAAPANTIGNPAPAPATPIVKSAWNAVRRLDPALRFDTALAAFVGAWLLLAVRHAAPSRLPAAARSGLLGLAATGFVLAGASIATLIAEQRLAPRWPEVVVTSESCTPRQGPDELAYAAASLGGRATIARGEELTVVEVRTLPGAPEPAAPAWLRVRERGAPPEAPTVWVRAADAEPVIPGSLRITGSATTPAEQAPPRAAPTPRPRPTPADPSTSA